MTKSGFKSLGDNSRLQGASLGGTRCHFYGVCVGFVEARGGRKEDVFINLVEVGRENWSFGNGIAQYADAPPSHLAKQ
jgi:hypothetical protein